MILKLHIGTEKTGSSFCQYLLANNRDFLLENQIKFPKAGKRESDMIGGRISPGNSKELQTYIERGDWESVNSYLRFVYSNAKKDRVNTLLLSNENLVRVFAIKDSIKKFETLCAEIGFEEVSMLLILRDPIDQALSLFKHRAKNGNLDGIESWVKYNYDLAQVIAGFFENIRKSNVHLSTRKYSNDGNELARIMFKDWLELPDEISFQNNVLVNSSLTLSELRLLGEFRRINPHFSRLFYDTMMSIPIDKKSSELQLLHYCQQIIYSHLQQNMAVWEECNSYLPNDEPLKIPNLDQAFHVKPDSNFSEFQLEGIARVLAISSSLKFRAKLILIKPIDFLKRFVITLKN